MATNFAIELVARPVIHLTVEGGKAAYQAAEEYWDEMRDEETMP